MRTHPYRAPLAAVSLVLALAACGGTPDEADLQKWSNDENGFQKLAAVVKDKEMPAETRVRALEVVVEKQQELRVRGMIERIADAPDRKAIAAALVDKLEKHVVSKAADQLPAKDTILMLTRYLAPEQLDRVQRSIAQWAFTDITWDTPAADLKTKLEARISASQIADLGPYGLESAAILLANGFIAEPMVRYLSGSPAPQAKGLLVKAMGLFIPAFLNVNPFYLDALRKTGDPAAAALLFKLYQDQKLDQKSRDACFSVGAMMLDQPTIKGKPESQPIIDELVKIGSAGNTEDRWLAAANILTIIGGAGLDQVLALFKDDKSYGDDPGVTGNSILDMCFAVHDEGQPDTAKPALDKALAGGNRVQKVIAVLCAKTIPVAAEKPTLGALAAAKNDVAIDDLLGVIEADGKKTPLTLGFLAKNAIEGIDLLAASNLDQLDPDKRKARHFVIAVEYKELGEQYAKDVETRYQDSIKK